MASLTKHQKKLVKELDQIVEIFGMNYSKIDEAEESARTPYLESIKDQYIRSEVIFAYVLIDEHMNNIICNYFFDKKRGSIKLWKTTKYKNFNYFILEKLSFAQKLNLAQKIIRMPGEVKNNVERIGKLRNALAHSFFPENLRGGRHLYRSKSIRTLEGVKLFIADRDKVGNFFFKKLYKVTI